MPKISVILTSFNHAKYICEAIESTLNQTFTDFELIILDDASSDNSWELINRYTDPRIKACRNEVNVGGAVGINRVISEMDSDRYVAMHHSDDVWEPDRLEKGAAFLDAHPEIGAVFSNAAAIAEDGRPLADKRHFYADVFSQPNRSRFEWLRHFFFRGNALCHPSVLIRKSCYEQCGSYPYTLAQLGDFDMWIRLCLKFDIHVFPERLVKYRVRDNETNASGNRPDVRIRDRSEFHHVLKHFLRIGTYEELVSIFPEAAKYSRPDGCEPKFIFAMVALGADSLPWAKFLGIETLFDLLADPETGKKIKSLYQFDYRDLIALTGKHDLFSLETVESQKSSLAERDAVVSRQVEHIAQLTRSVQAASLAVTGHRTQQYGVSPAGGAPRGNGAETGRNELQDDRRAYEKAAQLVESGRQKEGMAQLESLAEKGSTCWDVYNDLAVMHFNNGDNARAAPYFRKGIEIEGKSGATARNFATMLVMTGDMEGALAILGAILHEQPHDETVVTVIGDILSSLNPMPQDVWQKLVSDLRGEKMNASSDISEETGAHQHIARVTQSSNIVVESPQKTISAHSNEIKIFQIYYDEATKAKVDSNFIPLDNTENLRPDWCEYWPIRNVLLNHSFEDDTYLGFFSPRFFEKTGMGGKEVLEKIRCSDDEVVSFSPFFDLSVFFHNPFAQGEIAHPGLIETTQKVLSFLNVNLELNSLVCDQTTTIFSNYFVARYSFWKKWFSYTEKIFGVCEGPHSELKTRLVSNTRHRESAKYDMKVFVLERVVTLVMEELGIKSGIGIDVAKAPLSLPGFKEDFLGLLICDALKGQYKKTGLPIYKNAYFIYRDRWLSQLIDADSSLKSNA